MLEKALDVGTFTGFSAVGAALALEPGGQIIGMDITDRYWNDVGRKYAQEVANSLLQTPIFYLFIDIFHCNYLQAGVLNMIDLRISPNNAANIVLGKNTRQIGRGQKSTQFSFV